jgi:hypothetical protein
LHSGDRLAAGSGGFREWFRLDRMGRLGDTQFRLVPREEAYAYREPDVWSDGEAAGGGWADDLYRGLFGRAPVARDPRPDPPAWRGPSWARPWWEDDERPRRRQRRIDPDYPWGNRQIY